MASSTTSISTVFLGFVEIRLPLRLLPPERAIKVSHLAYKEITDVKLSEEEKQDKKSSLGILDAQYAMQSVDLIVDKNDCLLKRGDQLLLSHRLSDVISGTEVAPNSIIYTTRSANFGRVAVCLLLKNEEQACDIFTALKIKLRERNKSGRKFSSFLKSSPSSLRAPPFSSGPNSVSDDDSSDGEDIPSIEIVKPTPLITMPSLEMNVQFENMGHLTPVQAEIQGLIEHEKHYLERLIHLEAVRSELSKTGLVEIKSDLTRLLSKVNELSILHGEMCSELQSCEYNIENICQVFLKHEEEYIYYVYFIENIVFVEDFLHTHNAYFTEKYPDFLTCIRAPRMRLNHYVLTLDSLTKKASDPEIVKNTICMLKKYLKTADKMLLINSINNSPFDLKTKGDLIMSSDLALTKSKDIPKKIYHVILFQQELLIVTGARECYNYVTSFRTNELQLFDDIRGLYFSITLRSRPSPKYTFKAKTLKLQEQWREALKANSMENEQKVNLTRRSSSFISNYDNKDPSKAESEDETSRNFSPWLKRKVVIRRSTRSISSHNSITIDDESNFLKRSSKFLTNLTVGSLFPNLVSASHESSRVCRANCHSIDFRYLLSLIEEENRYIHILSTQYDLFIREEPKPPNIIIEQYKRLIDFHKVILKPKLENAKSTFQLLDCIIENKEIFIDLYSGYLVHRIMVQNEILNMDNFTYRCVEPVDHLEHYYETAYILKIDNQESDSVKTTLGILNEILSISNIELFQINVKGLPFELNYDTQILLSDRMKVKIQGKGKQDFQVVLLDEEILLLEIRTNNYCFSHSLRLECIGLGPPIDDYYSFQLEYRRNKTIKKNYTFRTSTYEIKPRWLAYITKILDKQVMRLRDEMKKKLGAPPEVPINRVLPYHETHL